MKIYISLPISGRSLDVCKERARRVKEMITRRGHEAVSPFEVCPQQDMPYAYYIGRDIEALMECDAILRCAGWSGSQGCALESECAHIYRKQIFDHVSQIKPLKTKS